MNRWDDEIQEVMRMERWNMKRIEVAFYPRASLYLSSLGSSIIVALTTPEASHLRIVPKQET